MISRISAVLSALALVCLVTPSRAQTPVAQPTTSKGFYRDVDLTQAKDYRFELGTGMTLGPETFLVVGSAEIAVDRFFSVGPLLQLGLGNESQMLISTLGGRLYVPIHALDRVEVSVQTGLGVIQRWSNSFSFYNFVYEVGLDAEYYLNPSLSVGLGGGVNITAAEAERVIGTLYLLATYRL